MSHSLTELQRTLRVQVFCDLDVYLPALSHKMRYIKNVTLGMGEAELKIVSQFVTADATVLDIGAHRGIYTQVFARKAKTVHAFEPVPQLSTYLRKVMPTNVAVHAVALSDHVGTAKLRIPYRGGYFGLGQGTIDAANDLGGRDPAEIEVRTETIDNYCKCKIDFIKIDVEGHEVSVLHGGLEQIGTYKPVIMTEVEERYHPGALLKIKDLLGSLGYRGYFFQFGRLIQLEHFSLGRDQSIKNVGTPFYVNNFIFLGKPNSTMLDK